ncbi:hypothetical protein K445DRAFT_214785 [Daldinia sp. EC12]|nr:hypothetical protein K445DRAFT_214785 [Daldinia sp. EC12]
MSWEMLSLFICMYVSTNVAQPSHMLATYNHHRYHRHHRDARRKKQAQVSSSSSPLCFKKNPQASSLNMSPTNRHFLLNRHKPSQCSN